MTKLFRDVDYYVTQASNSTQSEFELDFADVIEVFDTWSTTLVTEDGRTLIITWGAAGYYHSYEVIYETAQMEQHAANVNRVINILREIEVDGETMQYIIEKVGMSDQMLRQLVMSEPIEEVDYMYEERKQLQQSYKQSCIVI